MVIVFLIACLPVLDQNSLMADIVHQFQLGFFKHIDLEMTEKMSTTQKTEFKLLLSSLTELQDIEEILDILLEVSELYLEEFYSSSERSNFKKNRNNILYLLAEVFGIYYDESNLDRLFKMLSIDPITFSIIILQSRNTSFPLIPINLNQILDLYCVTFIDSVFRDDDIVQHCLLMHDFICLGEETGKLLTLTSRTLDHLFSALKAGATFVSLLSAIYNPKKIGNVVYTIGLLAKEYFYDTDYF